LVLVALAIGTVAFRQQRDLAHLRGELGNLQAAATQRQAAKAGTAQAKPAAAGNTLSESEKLELLRLRAEVTRLQQRLKELAPVKAENENLKKRVGPAGAGGAGLVPLPAGYVKRAEARFVGAATPEAALQSFFWALEQRDTNTLLQLLSPEAVEDFQRELDQRGPEDFWKESRIPGFRIVEVEQKASDHVVLKVEILPGEPPENMSLRWLENGWRLNP
jgi:hypothetical protein